MSNMGPPLRSPFQQNNKPTPHQRFDQRSPQAKKQTPSWGSGSPSWGTGAGGWGSGAIRKNNEPRQHFTSPPTNQFTSPPPQFPQNYMTSPRHKFNNFGNGSFRTPQPRPMYQGPSPQKTWSCDKNYRPASKRLQMKSPRNDPNANPGGSNDLDLYYHPSMLDNPWQYLKPVPVTHVPSATT